MVLAVILHMKLLDIMGVIVSYQQQSILSLKVLNI